MKAKLLVASLFSLFILTSKAQWYKQATTIPPTVVLSSIHCADATNCMTAGTTTTVRKTTDGINWNVTGTSGIVTKSFIKMLNKDTAILGQINGGFRKTFDGGATAWSNEIPGVSSADVYYNDIAFLSNTNFVAVGGNSVNHVNAVHVTATSINTGTSFTNLTGSGSPSFFGIEALTTTTFVACGGASSIYKSTNAGANWTAKPTGGPSTTTLYDIHFPITVTGDTGYAVGGHSTNPALGGVVYQTPDKGETWTSVSTGLPANALYGVHFVSKDTGYVVGHGGKIHVTTNAGVSWTAQISPVTSKLNKIYFPTKNVGYICGDSSTIIKTTTGGFIPPLVVNSGSDKSVCPGFCATLSGSPTASGGTTPYTYSWSPAAGSASSLAVCPSVTTTYTVTVTDFHNNVTVDSVQVVVYSSPALSISGLDSAYCNLTSSDTLLGIPSGGVFAGPGVSTGVFNAATAGAGTHTITYTYTDPIGGCIQDTFTTVTVLGATPVTSLCLVTVDSNITNLTNTVTWVKPLTGGIDSFRVYRLVGSTFTKIASLPYTADSKYVDGPTGIDPNTSPYSYAISTVDTCGIVTALSDTNTTMWLNVPSFSLPPKFTLTWTEYDGFPFTNYEVWRTTNGGSSWTKLTTVSYFAPKTYSDGPVSNPPLNSRYRIRVTHPSSGCNTGTNTFGYTLSNATYDYTGVNEIALDNWLNVYPNPSRGTFTMELSGTGFEVLGTKVYNMLGEMIYYSADKKKTAEISLPGVKSGVYHIEVITDGGNAHKKITIE